MAESAPSSQPLSVASFDPARIEAERTQVLRWLRPEAGPVYFIGMAGIGMAGLAALLRGAGFALAGSDPAGGRVADWLRQRGIPLFATPQPAHLKSVDWVVRSTAIGPGHPERRAAEQLGLPIFQRGRVLAAYLSQRPSIAVSGTHGKTTTAAMTAHILDACGRQPAYCIGGETTLEGSIAREGQGLCVAEVDESDGTHVYHTPGTAVITNIEFDHMEHYADAEAFLEGFRHYAASSRRLVASADDPRAAALARHHPRATSFGEYAGADVRALDIACGPGGSSFRVRVGATELPCELAVPGRHNVWNALAAIAAVRLEGVEPEAAAEALRGYRAVRRRFERVGEWGGAEVISDYAHHPTEIRCLVQTARTLGRPVKAVFQPHRYTRTRALRSDFPPSFEGVDRLWLVPVYAASEAPLPGGESGDLLDEFGRQGSGVPVALCSSLEEAWREIRADLRPGDLLLVVGAGDVERIAEWSQER